MSSLPVPADSAADRACVQVFLDRSRELVLASTTVNGLLAAWLEHAAQWQTAPHPRLETLLRPTLAAAVLHLGCQPPGLHTAWTVNIKELQANIFLAGDNTNHQIVARTYSEGVDVGSSSRLFLETQRHRHDVHRSVVAVDGSDALSWFEQFFERSDQISARLFALEDDEFVFIQGLPQVERDWLARVDARAACDLLASTDLELIERRLYSFACGCDGERIRKIVHGLFRDKPEELFCGDERVETSCPRCGRRWWLSRAEFFALDN